MRQRLPIVLSTTALIVALIGSTPIGHAARDVIHAVPPFAKKAGYANRAGVAENAKRLAGRTASQNPRPNQIPVLNASGQLPASIGAVGPKGPQGPQGPQGPKGDKGEPGSAAKLWAVVQGDGRITRKSGVDAVSRTDAGVYDVAFSQSVASCAVLATTADPFWTAGVSYTGDKAEVTILDLDQEEDNQAFTIAAFC